MKNGLKIAICALVLAFVSSSCLASGVLPDKKRRPEEVGKPTAEGAAAGTATQGVQPGIIGAFGAAGSVAGGDGGFGGPTVSAGASAR